MNQNLYDYFLIHPFGIGPRTLVVVYTGLTGGGNLNLDGEATIGSRVDGTVCRFFIESNTTASLWQLIPSNHADDPTNGWKRPLDYADETNQKVWKRLVTFGTGGGGGGVPATIDIVAAVDLPAFSLVTSTGDLANSNNMAHFGKVVGMTTQNVNAGFTATLTTDTEVPNPSWSWIPGVKLFLNGTTISTTPPSSGFSQLVAVATNATTIIVRIEPPILL